MRKNLIPLICFLIIPSFIFAKESWKPLSPETSPVQTEQGWKLNKIAKKEYDQLIIQKKVDLEVKAQTSFSFRYRILSEREILYLQFGLITKKNKAYFVILPRPTPGEWHTVTLSRDDFRMFDYTLLPPNMTFNAIELSLHTRGQINIPTELEFSEILINKTNTKEEEQADFVSLKNGETVGTQPNLPTATLSRDTGILFFHSDTANSNETFLTLKSSPFIEQQPRYAPANQNSFTLTGFGDRLLIEPRDYTTEERTDYANRHHLGWTIQTKAHNTILVDGYGQAIDTPGTDGEITRFLTLGNIAYFAGDASSPEIYQGRLTKFVRNIFAVDSSLFFVYDNLASNKSMRYDWLLHSTYPFTVDKEQKKVNLIGEKAKLDIRFLNPESLSYSLSSGFYPIPKRLNSSDPDKVRTSFPDQYHFSAYPRLDAKVDWVNASTFGNPEIYATQPSTKKETMTWLTALYLTPSGDTSEWNVMPVSTPGWLGGTIQLPSQYYHYLFSRDTSGPNKLEYRGYSFTGRGAIIGIATTGNVNRFILLDGQQVKMLGMTMFNASTPVTMLSEIKKGQAKIQLAVEKDASIELIPLGEPKEVYIDGVLQQQESKLWKYNPDTGKIQLSLPAGTYMISVTYLPNEIDNLQVNP
jgi:hypothetical protein